MNEATWTQIHTNGASTTFARWYTGQIDSGETTFIFEKMEVDITAGGRAEIFGREDFDTAQQAQWRVRVALQEQQ
jgi:hypothetical protein